MIKILSVSAIQEFSCEEKPNFDLMLTVKFRKGIWPLTIVEETTVWRHNETLCGGKTRLSDRAVNYKFDFYYSTAERVEKDLNNALNEYMGELDTERQKLAQKELFAKEIRGH